MITSGPPGARTLNPQIKSANRAMSHSASRCHLVLFSVVLYSLSRPAVSRGAGLCRPVPKPSITHGSHIDGFRFGLVPPGAIPALGLRGTMIMSMITIHHTDARRHGGICSVGDGPPGLQVACRLQRVWMVRAEELLLVDE
jgi:hypothetical protein